MSGNIYGRLFRIATWGESHGEALGVMIDGCPSGVLLSAEDIQRDLNRRKPGASAYSTKRNESDAVRILSGVFEGKTTGTPVSLIICNEDQRSHDYADISQVYRPGHADYGYDMKYGFRDYRGGGRSSARETAARVAAGAVAKKLLSSLGISIAAYVRSIAGICVSDDCFDLNESYNNPLCMPDHNAYIAAVSAVEQAMSEKDSLGGVVECVIHGLKAGIGEPVFDKLDAVLAHAVMSIGAVKGIEFGDGFETAGMKGSENNDSFYFDNGSVQKKTNHSGGMLGGLSDGSTLVFRAAFKPTPSIGRTQKTININNENIEINIKGRHDPLVAPRAVVVVEAMSAITLADYIMQDVVSRLENIQKIYGQQRI